MKKTKTLLLLASLAIFISCQPQTKKMSLQKSKCIIAGHVELSDKAPKVISLTTNDLILESRYVQTIDTNGFFKFEFDLLYPHNVDLVYNDQFASLFSSPNDSLFVNINSEKFKEDFIDYQISGKNAQLSEEIKLYKQFRKLDYFKSNGKTTTPQEYLAELKHHISLEDSVISEFIKLHPSSDAFIKWAKKDQLYMNANYLVDFEFQHYMNKTKYEGNIFKNKLFPINDDEGLLSSSYDLHLRHYALNTYFTKNETVQTLQKDKKYEEAFRTCLSDIKTNEEPGLSREIMSYLMLIDAFEQYPKTFVKLVDSCTNYLTEPLLIDLLNTKKNELTNQNDYKISLWNLDKEQEIKGDFFNQLKEKHKGKVIYLDVWASWCGPCRSEMAHAMELHKHYINDNIAFVNLCLSSKKADWKKAIKNLKVDGENYFFDQEQTELIRSKLHISGYPTYMIIDQNGDIVQNEAPRPSSGKLIKNTLNKLLNKTKPI